MTEQIKTTNLLNKIDIKAEKKTQETKPAKAKKTPFLDKKWKKITFWVVITLVAIMFIIGIISAVFAYNYSKKVADIQQQAYVLIASTKETTAALKTQNIPLAATSLSKTEAEYATFQQKYQQLMPLANFPVYGKFIKDGQQMLIAGNSGFGAAQTTMNAIVPYADLLGFAGEGSFEGGTAEDRVKTIIETLGMINPELDNISSKLTQTQVELSKIDTSKYPEKASDLLVFKIASFFKKDLKQYADFNPKAEIGGAIETIEQLTTTFEEYRPVIEKLPVMLGGDGSRKKYLVLFQNDNELRPTGGFLTAYSIMYMENGKISPEKSDDIYEIDKKFTKTIAIPPELGKYLVTEKTWHLRDMNIDPDFKNSMDIFLENYKTVKGEPQDIDGIIAIDTKVLTDLIDVLGPVEVEGYGNFSTEPDTKYTDAPQVVVALSEIITRPTNYIKVDRKGVLGPMMKAMLQKTYGAPKEQIPQLFTTVISNIEGRHIQAYFMDEEMQSAVEKINAAGRMIAPTDGSDFIAVIDANLGGAKSNLFISSDVVQEIEAPENGQLHKKVSVTYKNSRPGDNCNLEAGLLCLNSTNNDWQRVYLPLGAKLNSSQGYKNEPTVYEENGFTVVDGYFSLNPNSTAKVVLDYTIPYAYGDNSVYKTLIWKQGGVDEVNHLMNVNGSEETLKVVKDTVYQAKFE